MVRDDLDCCRNPTFAVRVSRTVSGLHRSWRRSREWDVLDLELEMLGDAVPLSRTLLYLRVHIPIQIGSS